MLRQVTGVLTLQVTDDSEVDGDERIYLVTCVVKVPTSRLLARVAKMFSSCATSGVPVIG